MTFVANDRKTVSLTFDIFRASKVVGFTASTGVIANKFNNLDC